MKLSDARADVAARLAIAIAAGHDVTMRDREQIISEMLAAGHHKANIWSENTLQGHQVKIVAICSSEHHETDYGQPEYHVVSGTKIGAHKESLHHTTKHNPIPGQPRLPAKPPEPPEPLPALVPPPTAPVQPAASAEAAVPEPVGNPS